MLLFVGAAPFIPETLDMLDPCIIATSNDIQTISGARPPRVIRCALASLALGGAERIVAEWLSDESASGRPCQLAINHTQAKETPLHPSVTLLRRPRWMSSLDFWNSVGSHWASLDPSNPIGAHLLHFDELTALARGGSRIIPVLHNDPAGWKGSPELWTPELIACAMGCAPFVKHLGVACNPSIFWSDLRHRPRVPSRACSPEARQSARLRFGADDGEFVVGMVGSLKSQKNYPKAVEVAAWLGSMARAKVVALGQAGPAASDLPAILEAARDMGDLNRFHWLGGSSDVGSFLSGIDALLSTSRHEGFPMAAMEALGAGIPVLAPALPGFEGIEHPLLRLYPTDAEPSAIAELLASLPPRLTQAELPKASSNRRMWSIPFGIRPQAAPSHAPILFATANLNAGGAQRSLCNLLIQARNAEAASPGSIGPLARARLIVCDDRPTHPEFSNALARASIPFEALGATDPIRAAESLIERATESGAACIVFWNADAKLKLLIAKFLPASIRIIDVSPGDYAFEEFDAAGGFGSLADYSNLDYSQRIHTWVSKRPCEPRWLGARAEFIPNGCPPAPFPSPPQPPEQPRFIVSGRIAPSKRLDVILEAFALLRVEIPSAELHVAGQAEARCEALAAELMARHGPEQGVHWLGADPTLSFYAQAWSAQATLGTAQGSPNAVLEALSAGIPVIANDDGGTAYAMGADEACGPAGILLPEHPTSRQVADALLLSLSPSHQQAWRQRARDLSQGRHSMDRMIHSYAQLMRACLNPGIPSPRGAMGSP